MSKIKNIISKFTTETYIKCDFSDINDLISHYYGFDEYNLACEEDLVNYASVIYNLDGKVTEQQINEVAEMTKTKDIRPYRTRELLNYMISEGVLAPGQYLILISW